MTIQFNAKTRVLQGTSASRRLRRAGSVPAVVYGSGAPAQIEVDHNEIFHALRNEAFHASVLTMVLDGANQSVILKDTQWHPYKQQVLHLDFQRVDATHKIHVKVPLHFINADIAPGVKLEGGMVSHPLTELDLECLPGDAARVHRSGPEGPEDGLLHPRFRPDPAEGCEGPDPR
jgi:large subunit ribosomal protein L25